jgi:hypothetical protein
MSDNGANKPHENEPEYPDDNEDADVDDAEERLASIDKQKNWNGGFVDEEGSAAAIANPELIGASSEGGDEEESDDAGTEGDVDPYGDDDEGVPPVTLSKSTVVVDDGKEKKTRQKENKRSKRKERSKPASKGPGSGSKKKKKEKKKTKGCNSRADAEKLF